VELLRVELSAAALPRIDLVPAAGQPTTAPEVFAGPVPCGLGGAQTPEGAPGRALSAGSLPPGS
jgi:hypothetical protein